MTRYNAGEILQFAIRIEENGRLFYLQLAKKFDQEEAVRRLFEDLAAQEGDHRRFFEGLAAANRDGSWADDLPEEYFLYLRAFADHAVFSDEEVAGEVAKIADIEGALSFSMKREADAVSYYTELKAMVPEEDHAQIEAVIAEEKRHYLQLHQMKEEVAPEHGGTP